MEWANLARRVRAWGAIPGHAARELKIHRGAEGYGLAPLPLRVAEQVLLLAMGGVSAEEYYRNGLANLVHGLPRKCRFLGDFQSWRWLDRINSMRPTTADKLAFHAHLLRHGLPAPTLLAYISDSSPREGESAATRLPPGVPLLSRSAFLDWLKRENTDDFLLKPVAAQNGIGILSVTGSASDGSGWREVPSGRPLGLPQIGEHLDRYNHAFLVQERLGPHENLSCFSSKVLQTARIVTVRMDDEVHLIGASFKISNGGCAVDNLVGGRNSVAAIDIQTGTLGKGFALKDGLIPFESDIHPVTKARISGTVLPCWSDAIAATLKLASTFPPPQYLGWDIGLTTRGVVIIEGNARPDAMLLQLPRGRGLLEDRDIRRLLRLTGRFHGYLPRA